MKKVYTIAMALFLASASQAQNFFNAVPFKGAFPVTDGMTGVGSNDWTAGWTNFDPENTNYPSTNITVSSDITSNTTWTTGNVVLLQNKIYVKNNAVLTIQPGVIIRGDFATQGTLIISKGSKIVAEGSVNSPIVFTSNNSVGNRAEGDWGGLVLCGNGIINQPGGVANIEGLTASADNQYGGNDNTDSSGVLKYVRVEFAGIPLQPNKEVNSFTFGAVGSRTVLDYLQTSFAGDDAFEFFGGAVNAKHLVAFRTLDDDFDTDFGFRGNLQYGLVVRDKDLSDAAGDSNGFESDNEATSPYNSMPKTSAVFSNFTIIGPKRDGSVALPVGEKFERGVYIRRNSGISVFNSLVIGWEKGFHAKDAGTVDNFTTNDTSVFAYNVISADVPAKYVIDATSNATLSFYSTIHTGDMNDTLSNVNTINFVNGFPANLNQVPDFRLQNSSVVSSGADFSHPKLGSQSVGIQTGSIANSLKLFPNPAGNNFKIKLELAQNEKVNIMMYDITGKRVMAIAENEVLNSGSNTFNIDTQNISNGMYLVSFRSENLQETLKVIINK